MLLRTFTARTAAEAMAQVRRALGDEAIILSTQDDDDGGVRITAALEPTETASAPHSATAPATELEAADRVADVLDHHRSEEHTSELQSLMRISYAVFCLKKKH